MALTTEFVPLELSELRREAAVLKADGWRFMQTHAVAADEGIDLYYSFMKDGHAVNYRISSVTKDQPVPSITDLFLAAFVFENEARELFGVDMRDIAIDFHGAMYAPAQTEPMTFMTPEQKAAKEKAAKIAAAKAAKEAAGEGEKPEKTASPKRFVLSDEKRAQLEERLKTMSPEKVAKVRAALAAREAEATASPAPEATTNAEAEAAAAKADATISAKAEPDAVKTAPAAKKVDSILEDKLAALDPAKAEKVRAAIAAKAAKDAGLPVGGVAASITEADEAPSSLIADEQLEQLISQMDDVKAAKVRAALSSKGGE